MTDAPMSVAAANHAAYLQALGVKDEPKAEGQVPEPKAEPAKKASAKPAAKKKTTTPDTNQSE